MDSPPPQICGTIPPVPSYIYVSTTGRTGDREKSMMVSSLRWWQM